jgi:hypothetical protein
MDIIKKQIESFKKSQAEIDCIRSDNTPTLNTIDKYALVSIAESLEVIAGEQVSTDELRIAIEEFWDNDFATAEDYAANLLEKFDIRRKK